MKKNIVFLSDFPLSIAQGGKEIQMLLYLKFMNLYYKNLFHVKLLDYFNENQKYEIIHLFGHSNWFYDIVKNIKANFSDIKIIISPTFYYIIKLPMRLTSIVGKIFPIPNFFSYKNFFLNSCDVVIVNSISEKIQLKNLFNIYENKFEVIPNFIESEFEKLEKKNIYLFKEKYNIDNYLLSVGHLDERKNTLNLIRAFLEIYDYIKLKLVIIGNYRFRDKKKREQVEKLIIENKDKIIHINNISRDELLKSAYYNCKAHLLPSFLETPGLSNLEAAIFRKSILVGDCPPVKEYFKNYAIYCKPDDIDSIKEGILKVIKKEENLPLYKHVKENYTEKQIIPKLCNIYKKLL